MLSDLCPARVGQLAYRVTGSHDGRALVCSSAPRLVACETGAAQLNALIDLSCRVCDTDATLEALIPAAPGPR